MMNEGEAGTITGGLIIFIFGIFGWFGQQADTSWAFLVGILVGIFVPKVGRYLHGKYLKNVYGKTY